jgi:hypothetical protein
MSEIPWATITWCSQCGHKARTSGCACAGGGNLCPCPCAPAEEADGTKAVRASMWDHSPRYHPDPTVNAEVAADAAVAESADLAAGYPPRAWMCPCGAVHRRGYFQQVGTHRCLGCGYIGTGGVLLGPGEGPPNVAQRRVTDAEAALDRVTALLDTANPEGSVPVTAVRAALTGAGCDSCRQIGPLLTAPGTSGRSWLCETCGTVWTGSIEATADKGDILRSASKQHEGIPSSGTVVDRWGYPCPAAQRDRYPLGATCATCTGVLSLADGTADWRHI